jgi:hypothetical protein
MADSVCFSLSVTGLLNTHREHFSLSLQRWQTNSALKIAGNIPTMRFTAAGILLSNAQARRLTETLAKSENCGVYILIPSKTD